jgi:hypothetical protein
MVLDLSKALFVSKAFLRVLAKQLNKHRSIQNVSDSLP